MPIHHALRTPDARRGAGPPTLPALHQGAHCGGEESAIEPAGNMDAADRPAHSGPPPTTPRGAVGIRPIPGHNRCASLGAPSWATMSATHSGNGRGPHALAAATSALCGALLHPDKIETVAPGHGIPCDLCLLSLVAQHPPPATTPTPEVADVDSEPLAATAAYRAWDWPVTLRHNQLWLNRNRNYVITSPKLAARV